MLNISELEFCRIYLEEISKLESRFNHIINKLKKKTFLPLENCLLNKNNELKNNISIPIFFPYWLAENFQIKKDVKEDLMLAGAFYSRSILISDSLMDDNKNEMNPEIQDRLISKNILEIKAMEILRKIFPLNSSFWKFHDKYMIEYWNSCAWEKRYCSKIRKWSTKDIKRLGAKSAPFKIAAAAFSILGNKEKQIGKFEKLVEYSQTGIQMIDDINDWNNDLTNNNYTYFLCQTAFETRLVENLTGKNIITSRPQSALITTLDSGIIYLKKTISIVEDLNLRSLKEFILVLIKEINNAKKIAMIFPKAILIHGTFRFMNIVKKNN